MAPVYIAYGAINDSLRGPCQKRGKENGERERERERAEKEEGEIFQRKILFKGKRYIGGREGVMGKTTTGDRKGVLLGVVAVVCGVVAMKCVYSTAMMINRGAQGGVRVIL